MLMKDRRLGPVGVDARVHDARPTEHNLQCRDNNQPANLPFMESVAEAVLRVAERCEDSVAQIAYSIRCLQAARGGTSGTSQTAASHLAHHRLKSVPLATAHRTLLEAVARSEETAAAAVGTAAERMLELEIHRANLRRCEAAIEERARDKVESKSGVLAQARRVVAKLGRLGVLEGHWSTVTSATAEKMAAMILADNAAAGLGLPDNPRKDWKRRAAK